MSLNIDHVLFAWPDHDEILSACEAVGLVPRFGGVHDGGETQNSLIAFPDGSLLRAYRSDRARNKPRPLGGDR